MGRTSPKGVVRRNAASVITGPGRTMARPPGADGGGDAGVGVRDVRAARDQGEFIESMPVEDVALQLVSIANSAGPITQDASDFDRLEQLYLAFGRIVQHASTSHASPPC